jgi:hypothetical protein
MMCFGVGMSGFMADHHPDDISSFLVTFVNRNGWYMFFFTFVTICFDNFGRSSF